MFKKIILSIVLFGTVFASDRQKVVLITGTAHGIGKSTAQYLIDKGYIVYGGDILVEENLYLNDIGGVALEMDVTKQDHVENAINQIIAEQGRIDVLVNNAGISPSSLEDYTTSSLLDLTEEAFGQTIKVNVLAPYICTKILLPMLIKTEEPKVINVGSTSGLMTPVLSGAYGVSKAALHALTIASANELAGVVAVNALSPGWVLTDMAPDAPDHPRTSAESALWLIRQDNNVTGKLFHDKALLGWSG